MKYWLIHVTPPHLLHSPLLEYLNLSLLQPFTPTSSILYSLLFLPPSLSPPSSFSSLFLFLLLHGQQLGNYEEGAKCFFTFAFHNPDSELVSVNSDFYRKELELGPNEFIWREPPTQPHQDPFLEGWSKAEYMYT